MQMVPKPKGGIADFILVSAELSAVDIMHTFGDLLLTSGTLVERFGF